MLRMGCFSVLRGKKKKHNQYLIRTNPSKENQPTTLPEPETCGPSLQSAPPSFRTRTKNSQQTIGAANSRARALSAPSSLDVSQGPPPPLPSAEFEELEESNVLDGMGKDHRLPNGSNPQPLPLPSPRSVLKNLGSFKSFNSSSSMTSGPLPLPPLGGLRAFSFEEIAVACQNFSADCRVSEGLSSVIYRASFVEDALNKKLEATVTCLLPSTQGFKEFVNEVNIIASLQHPQLCKLLGFHARESSDQRMLVYERPYHGGLDRLLYGRSDGLSMDWATRIKVALFAARGLAFLHEEGPFQAMYNDFSAANIQIDKDFSAKLSGYGCVIYNPETNISNTSVAAALPVEMLEKGLLTPKSNVWSFGIVLLELLTGRRNLDSRFPKEERNLVKWSKPYLTDDCRLSLIMDSRLKGRFPPKAVRTIADIALKCLQKEPSERPTMRVIVEALENIQDMKYPCRFPLQEPSAVCGKQMFRSPSLNGIIIPPTSRFNFSPSPSKKRVSVSEISLPLPPRTCASTLNLEDSQIMTIRKFPSPTF